MLILAETSVIIKKALDVLCPSWFSFLFVFTCHQEKFDIEVLCKENPLLPETAEHPEESEDLSGAAR